LGQPLHTWDSFI